MLMEWASGRLLRREYGAEGDNDPRVVSYEYDDQTDEVLIEDHLGRSIVVKRDGAGRVTEIVDPRGASMKYRYNAAGELAEVEDREGGLRQFHYDKEGWPHYLTRMEIVREPENVVVEYDYDGDGRLAEVETGAGEIVMAYEDFAAGGGRQTVRDEATGGESEMVYDAAGRVAKQVDMGGVVTEYAYFDGNGNENTEPAGAIASQTVGGVTTEFDYDLSPYQLEYFGIEGIAQQFVDFWLYQGSGGGIVNDYDQGGALKPGYLTAGQVQPTNVATPAVGPDGQPIGAETNDVALAYDPLSTMPDGTGKIYSVTDPEGRVIGLNYGNGATRNDTASIDGPSSTTVSNTYISSGAFTGRLSESVTSRGGDALTSTTYQYTTGTLVSFSELDALIDDLETTHGINRAAYGIGDSAWLERQIVTSVNGDDDPTSSTTFLDALGNAVFTRNANDNWSVSLFDSESRVVFQKDPEENVTANQYDDAGLLLESAVTSADGGGTSVTQYIYDDLGRQIEVLRDGVSVTKTEYLNEPGKRIRTVTDEAGNKTTTETDAAGRVIREIFESAEGSRRETVYGYDEHGRRDYVRGPRGLITRTKYDAAGRENKTTVEAEGVTYTNEHGYDRHGRKTWSQSSAQAEANPAIYATYLYETTVNVNDIRYGQLIKTFHEDDDKDPTNNGSYSGYYEEYAYDDRGRQIEITTPRNVRGTVEAVTTRTEYDDEDRETTVTFNYVEGQSATSERNVQYQFTYDQDTGEPESVTYPSGMVRQWSEIEKKLEEVESGRVETTEYDAETGMPETIGKPEGTLHYAYDAKGALASIGYLGHRILYDYDAWGRLNQVDTSAGGRWDYQYNVVNQVTNIVNTAAGVSETRNYDALGRLLMLEHRNSNDNDSVMYKTEFELAPDGSRIAATEIDADGDESHWDYQYDPLGRLVRERFDADNNGSYADPGDRDIVYAYDADSNRVSMSDMLDSTASRTYSYYTGTQRLEFVERSGGEKLEEYLWTGDGEVDKKYHWANGQRDWHEQYTWGPNSTLLSVENVGGPNDGLRVEYTYDDAGVLVRRKLLRNGAIEEDERYLVDSNNPTGYSQVVAVLDGETNAVKTLYSYGERLLAQTSLSSTESRTDYLLGDALGSIRVLTGPTGASENQIQQYAYTAFGSPLSGEPGDRSLTNYAFTGQMRDPTTGLQYHRARWLDTSIGRWSSVDPQFDFPGNFATLYGYCERYPLNSWDKSGTLQFLEVVSVAGIVSFLAQIAVLPAATYISRAFGVSVYTQTYIGGINRFLEVLDWVLLPFDIFAGLKFLGKLLTKKGITEFGQIVASVFRQGGRYVSIGVKGVVMPAGRALRHLPDLPRRFEKYKEVVMVVQKLANEARDLLKQGIYHRDVSVIRQHYNRIPHVKHFCDLVEDGAEFWQIRRQAGNAIEAIVRTELLRAIREGAFPNMTIKFQQSVLKLNGSLGRVDILVDSILKLDPTASKQAGKATRDYGKDAFDILYDSY